MFSINPRIPILIFALVLTAGCKNDKPKNKVSKQSNVDTLSDISTNDFREFKVLDSKFIKKTEMWESLDGQLADFSTEKYIALKPFILEKDISFIQKKISDGSITYELLTKFYLYRIRKFDRENELSLNAVISINPKVIAQARQKDNELKNKDEKHL